MKKIIAYCSILASYYLVSAYNCKVFATELKSDGIELHTHFQIYPLSVGVNQVSSSAFLDTNNVSTGFVASFLKEKSDFWHGRRVTDDFFYKRLAYKSAFWGKQVISGEQIGYRSFPFGWSIFTGNANPLLLTPIPTVSFSAGGEFVVEKIASIKMPDYSGTTPFTNPYTSNQLRSLLSDRSEIDVAIGPSIKIMAEHKFYALSIAYGINLSMRYSLSKGSAFRSYDLMSGVGIFWIHN